MSHHKTGKKNTRCQPSSMEWRSMKIFRLAGVASSETTLDKHEDTQALFNQAPQVHV